MDRCSICPQTRRCVAGDGPAKAAVVCIGEAPGKTEDAGGRPFIGDAGREFNENYLHLAGLKRDDVYITNTVKCRPDQNRKPTAREVEVCSKHWIGEELREREPEVVILMGATPCSMVDGLDLEAEHGIPRRGRLFDWEGWLVPINHPAAGLHDTAMMIPMLADWEKLYRWLHYDEWQWAEDKTVKDYGLIDTKVEAEEWLHRLSFIQGILLAGGDTESHGGVPYSWQLCLEPNVARMIMLKNKEVCWTIALWVREQIYRHRLHFVFHNAFADLDIFENQLRLPLIDGLFSDTMQEAYQFALGPHSQGLKFLSRRFLGRKRKSWEETVTPWSKEIIYNWLTEGFRWFESNWQIVEERQHKKTGRVLESKVHRSEAEKLSVELIGYLLSSSKYPIWEKVQERFDPFDLKRLEEECGKMPVKGIAHCPIDVQIEYACSDPDDTRALKVEFIKMREQFEEQLQFQEEDRDA